MNTAIQQAEAARQQAKAAVQAALQFRTQYPNSPTAQAAVLRAEFEEMFAIGHVVRVSRLAGCMT